MKACWPAPERNKGPLLDVLSRVMPSSGMVLEIASGTGQHAVHFATHLPSLTFQPSDVDEQNLASIRAWVREAALPNLREPVRLDVCAHVWKVEAPVAIFNANMVHITPWECSIALFSGASRHLDSGGVLVLYGPFRIAGEHTAPSNAAFDRDLRERDPRWGVRDLEALATLGRPLGLTLEQRIEMPANNQSVVFRKGPIPDAAH
ncbi:MAG TPA: DUF938 domain-containing protein [Polyangiaceae bacterium]